MDERVRQALFDGRVTPLQIDFALGGRSLHRLGKLHHPLGGIGAAVENDVFDVLQQILRDVFVHDQLTGIDDPHVQAGLDRVEQKRRVNGLANDVVAAE